MSVKPFDHIADDDDLDALFGKAEPRRPTLVPDNYVPYPTDNLPTADDLAHEQFVAGVQRMHEDTTQYPEVPWPTLAHHMGPMCPGDLVLVGARTGGGKSLFLQNLFDALIVAGRFGLYVGLEQTPEHLRIKWACLRAGIPPRLILAPKKHERGTPAWQHAMDVVQREYKWQFEPAQKARAFFSSERKIDRTKLRQWTEWAVDHGCDHVVIDHVDRLTHGDGTNSFAQLSETIQLAKDLAVEHRIVMLMASQVGRPADALEQFMPPSLHNLRGAGTKEEESDTVLGIYRPLRPDVTDQDLKAVRQGLRDVDTVIVPNQMGVMLLKHRLDGPVRGKVARLTVEHGRVHDDRLGQMCPACGCSLSRHDVHHELCTPCATARGAR